VNEILKVPTVEQVNLEHRLAHGKAAEAVQHATNCGLMLLQIKAGLNHGEWLPWLNGEIESGRLEVKSRQARSYMRLASNWQRAANLTEAPSIRAALELLSDKEPEEQQGDLIDVEAERQLRLAAQERAEAESEARGIFEQRARESQEESNERRKRIRELEAQIDLLNTKVSTEPEKVIVKPDDYDSLKETEKELRRDLAEMKRAQRELVQQQVVAKLKEREDELSEIDRKVKHAETLLAGLQSQIDRYSLRQRELKVHLETIESARVAMALLAANLEGFGEVIDQDHELRQWRALADMLRQGAAAIEFFVGDQRAALSVIRGGNA